MGERIDVVTSALRSSSGDLLIENTAYYQLIVHQAATSREEILLKLMPI